MRTFFEVSSVSGRRKSGREDCREQGWQEIFDGESYYEHFK
jgi:hypothetical protein